MNVGKLEIGKHGPNFLSACISLLKLRGCKTLLRDNRHKTLRYAFNLGKEKWELWEQPFWNNKGNNRILPIRFHCAVCIYGACLKWLLPELSFTDRWSRGTEPVGTRLVTWHKITHAGEQVEQWDFLNKGRSRRTGTSCIVLEVPLCNLLISMCDFVPCDRIMHRAYYW